MPLTLVPVWTAVDIPDLVQCTLEWHMENRSSMQLMVDFRTDALPARLIAMDQEHLLVHCQGMPKLSQTSKCTYTLLAKSDGGDALVTGEIQRISDSGDVFTLRIPHRIDVGMPSEYLSVADNTSTTPYTTEVSKIPAQSRKCRASHRIIGNGLCIRRGQLHWFSHLRRLV